MTNSLRSVLSAPARAAAFFVLVSAALLAPACGRLKPLSSDDGAVANADAGPGRCMLGASSIVTSNLCGTNPELCGDVCGATCVNLAGDSDNCGACGVTCNPLAACDHGVCGAEPQTLVPAAPGCHSLRVALDAGQLTWADLGHGTIKRIATSGGPVTTVASDVLATIYTGGDQPLVVNGEPRGAGIVVHAGTTYWIEATEAASVDEGGLAHGGAGVTIRAATADGTATTLLPAALAPGPSPVSSMPEGRTPIEATDTKPPISAIALSPDARTLYFSAGTRLYKLPSAGAVTADDVQLVGFTSGPEHGFATSLAADDHRLFFPSTVDTWVEIFDFSKTCDAAALAAGYCPERIFGSDPIPLLDTIAVKDNFLMWAKEGNVWRGDLTAADPTMEGHVIFADTIAGFGVTGFAVGTNTAYFGEDQYIEKGGFNVVEGTGPPPAHMLARGQTWPSSFAIDGTNVYWTTAACDIAFLADSPQ